MKALLLIALLTPCSANAFNLIVPLVTAHTGGWIYNSQNYGAGVEYKNYSLVYISKNSYNEPSVYFTRYWKYKASVNIQIGLGVAIANGYHLITPSGVIALPIFMAQYKNFRAATSYPASKIHCPKTYLGASCDDGFNLQYVIKF